MICIICSKVIPVADVCVCPNGEIECLRARIEELEAEAAGLGKSIDQWMRDSRQMQQSRDEARGFYTRLRSSLSVWSEDSEGLSNNSIRNILLRFPRMDEFLKKGSAGG